MMKELDVLKKIYDSTTDAKDKIGESLTTRTPDLAVYMKLNETELKSITAETENLKKELQSLKKLQNTMQVPEPAAYDS